jgi:hypothetical protein
LWFLGPVYTTECNREVRSETTLVVVEPVLAIVWLEREILLVLLYVYRETPPLSPPSLLAGGKDRVPHDTFTTTLTGLLS